MALVFKLCGIVGLLILCAAIYVKKEGKRDVLSVGGGAFLLVYSIYLRDTIFIVLQAVFIISGLYEIWRIKQRNF